MRISLDAMSEIPPISCNRATALVEEIHRRDFIGRPVITLTENEEILQEIVAVV